MSINNMTVDVPLTWGPNVAVQDPAALSAKINGIKAKGTDSLQVITDFDRTITKHMVNGVQGRSSHGILEASGMLGPSFDARAKALFSHYYPLEIDPTIDYHKKYQLMEEWWGKTHALFASEPVNKNMFPFMVEKANVSFRDGTHDLFKTLNHWNIPLLVFSAGLGDIIEEIFKQKGLLDYENVHVVSNFMTFNEAGFVSGFRTKNIHTLNKSEAAIEDTPYYATITTRPNIILMGDSLGDIQMSEGVSSEIVLKIGFYNYENK
eukprot:Ihof_evm2s729 gene=Ihof_evmTU2s729